MHHTLDQFHTIVPTLQTSTTIFFASGGSISYICMRLQLGITYSYLRMLFKVLSSYHALLNMWQVPSHDSLQYKMLNVSKSIFPSPAATTPPQVPYMLPAQDLTRLELTLFQCIQSQNNDYFVMQKGFEFDDSFTITKLTSLTFVIHHL